ncbi:uncharacterized protein VTP21DRAFT_4580 [Calcarisporiella thermophila]|uniref:uncharacterized protein n=1 Tax=Calcarisporiella thermophila TaxID=911321 RepID=UPI003744A03E
MSYRNSNGFEVLPEPQSNRYSTQSSNGDNEARRRSHRRSKRESGRIVQFHADTVDNSGRPQTAARSTLQRQRSLTRPERQRARVPMLRESVSGAADLHRAQSVFRRQPTNAAGGADESAGAGTVVEAPEKLKKKFHCRPWTWFSWVATCCFPSFFLRSIGKTDPHMQQAWREKVTLCLIALFFMGILGFLTFGLQRSLCPENRSSFSYTVRHDNGTLSLFFRENVTVNGQLYGYPQMTTFLAKRGITLNGDFKNVDMSGLFDGSDPSCQEYDKFRRNLPGNCSVVNPMGGPPLQTPNGACISLAELQKEVRPLGVLFYEWENLAKNNLDPNPKLMVLNNAVMNMSSYKMANDPYFGPAIDKIIQNNLGKDATASFLAHQDTKNAIKCIQSRYMSGVLSSETFGCFASNIIMYVSLAVIVALIVVRFAMAVAFSWCIAHRLVKPGGRHGMPWSRNGNKGHIQRKNSFYDMNAPNPVVDSGVSVRSSFSMNGSPASLANKQPRLSQSTELSAQSQVLDTKLYTVMLVTCYSEGEEGLRTTLDSLAATTYSPKHKMFFIVCDGIITGSGNSKSTPDLVIDMLTFEDGMRDPKPCSYVAIADGEKQHNMAKVYAGHYVYNDMWVPAVCVVKCGSPAEATAPKPGNRGKRDSQVILMAFFQRVLFNDRMTELDYEIFWKITWLMGGVTPDKFEIVLMVDADTKVMPNSLDAMVAAMVNDVTIMGLCGETRIANKRQTWVTMIQVFEYYINHHYAKAFESVFGGVTCLPGCFCMYRIKAPKNGAWVPILANPDILLEYNQNVVTTLHAKNLLLLGEDRFLSTLMLRTFPKRQMLFVPQAICKTVVPDTFSVLLSQRRRWINSTIHNLMELVLVSDLCGIACLSMQFAVFVELVGTIVLPAAITFTGWLILSSFIIAPQTIPLLLLAAVLGLPGLLIVITTRKLVYVGWMLVYLLALPIWNCVLPIYAYWHFDDFSWGQTRKVQGETGKDDHGKKEGEFDSSNIAMKKWEEWERERLGMQKPARPLTMRQSMFVDAFGAGKGAEFLTLPGTGPGSLRPLSHTYSTNSMLLTPEMLNGGMNGLGMQPGLAGVGGMPTTNGASAGRYVPSRSPRLARSGAGEPGATASIYGGRMSTYGGGLAPSLFGNRMSTYGGGSSPSLFGNRMSTYGGNSTPSLYGSRISTYLSPRNPSRLSVFPASRPVVSSANGRTSALMPGIPMHPMPSPVSSDGEPLDHATSLTIGNHRRNSRTMLLSSPTGDDEDESGPLEDEPLDANTSVGSMGTWGPPPSVQGPYSSYDVENTSYDTSSTYYSSEVYTPDGVGVAVDPSTYYHQHYDNGRPTPDASRR